jgi:signal transduction histidine kinase
MRLDSYYDTKARIVHDNKVLARKHTESRTEFVRNVFHEIRTPMHVLSNFFCDSNPSREDFEDMKHHTGNVTYSTVRHCYVFCDVRLNVCSALLPCAALLMSL